MISYVCMADWRLVMVFMVDEITKDGTSQFSMHSVLTGF